MPPVALVAFDLDDTLYPERQFVRSGFRAVSDYLLAEGIADRPLLADLEAAFEAGVRGRTFDHVLQAAGIAPTEPLIRDLVEVYRTHRGRRGRARPDIRLYDDAERALGRVAARGIRAGLISDGPLESQEAKIDALGLAGRLDAIVLTAAWGRQFWKPHPRAFQEMGRRLALAPEACLYVADNPAKDFAGPAAALWRPSVRIRRGDGLYRDVPLPPGAPVAATLETLDALEEVLERS